MRLRSPLIGIVAASMLLAACGNNSSDDEADVASPRDDTDVSVTTKEPDEPAEPDDEVPVDPGDYQSALAAVIEELNTGVVDLDAEQAGCIAERAVEVVGTDRLTAVGDPQAVQVATRDGFLAVFDLDMSELEEVAQSTFDCIPDLLETLFATTATEVSESTLACLRDVVTEDVVVEAFAISFGGNDPAAALSEVSDAADACRG